MAKCSINENKVPILELSLNMGKRSQAKKVAEYFKKNADRIYEEILKLCVENMPSDREAPDNHLYGSCALNISSLAEKLGVGICWDVGHANISGYKQSEQMQIMKGKIDVLHIHDNGGKGQKDAHMLPFDGTVTSAHFSYSPCLAL